MNTKKQEMYLHQFDGMINSRARKYSNIFGMEFDEVLGEAYYIFVKSCDEYDERLACFSTFLHNNLERSLPKFCEKNTGFGIVMDWPEDIYEQYTGIMDDHEELYFLNEKLNTLSSMAKKIIDIIFTPEKLMMLETKKETKYNWRNKVTQKSIKDYLYNHGYTVRTIDRAFSEIKGAVC